MTARVRQVPGWTRSGFLSPPVSPTSNPRFEGLTARAPPAVPTLADAQRLGVLGALMSSARRYYLILALNTTFRSVVPKV